MNAEPETVAPKRKLISIPFLLIAVVLVVGGYPAGKWAMEKIMTMQSMGEHSGEAVPPADDVSRSGETDMAEQRNSMGGAPPANNDSDDDE